MENTRNSKVLSDFTDYCLAHPEYRFWQALRNWSGYGYILLTEDRETMYDTFYWEGKGRPQTG